MGARKGLFRKYPNPIFIETGSLTGHGILQALGEGFTKIYSIEIVHDWFVHCSNKFQNVPGVHLLYGDSAIMLEGLMKIIDVPCTFWLDAHMGTEKTPLLQELEIIKNHHIKTHTILIDDLRDWKIEVNGVNPAMLKAKLREINPKYKFVYEWGFQPNDILVAVAR